MAIRKAWHGDIWPKPGRDVKRQCARWHERMRTKAGTTCCQPAATTTARPERSVPSAAHKVLFVLRLLVGFYSVSEPPRIGDAIRFSLERETVKPTAQSTPHCNAVHDIEGAEIAVRQPPELIEENAQIVVGVRNRFRSVRAPRTFGRGRLARSHRRWSPAVGSMGYPFEKLSQ
jgi:hypothetical protein